MRFLVDANLSPVVAAAIRQAGHDALHVADLEMLTATDSEIFDRAVTDGLTVITADSDFGTLLALRRALTPSVVHLRGVAELPPGAHVALLIANLPAILDDLETGAIASLSPTRLAVRSLPIR